MQNTRTMRTGRAALALLLAILLTGAPLTYAEGGAPEPTPPAAAESLLPSVTETPDTAPAETPQVTGGPAEETEPPAAGETERPAPEESQPPAAEGAEPPAAEESAPVLEEEVALFSAGLPAEIDPAHPLVLDSSLPVEVDLAVNAEYPWAYDAGKSSDGYDAYVSGNSGTKTANVSNLALTVRRAGVLGFDWKVSTRSSGNYKLCYQVNEPITVENAADCVSINSNRPWTHVSVSITEDMLVNGSATVYIAYVRGGTMVGGTNYGAVANVEMNEGRKDVALTVEGADCGSVTGLEAGVNQVMMGDTIVLTAAPSDGSRFYGWVVDGVFKGNAPDYTQTVVADTSIRAVFGGPELYTARLGGTFYPAGTPLETVLAAAESSDVVELLSDQTLTQSAEIPAGVTLLVPYGARYDADGTTDSSEDPTIKHTAQIAGDSYVYRTLTVSGGAVLTVKGTLRVGSVIGYPQMSAYSGHTSGAHGKLVVDGAVDVAAGGTLDCWGIAEGGGTVTVQKGGLMYEPFIVVDFSGGSNTANLYLDEDQSPFKQYAMQNVQCRLELLPGSTLYARCNLFASGGFNKTDAPIVAPDGLFAPTAGTTIIRTYDPSRQTSTAPGIGRMTYAVRGGLDFQSLTLDIGAVVTTDTVDFPIPYNYGFVLEDGAYTVPQRLKLMPGAEMTVAEHASLDVTGRFFVLDGLIQGSMSGKRYPASAVLKAGGLPQSGMLTVDGTLNVRSGAAFGGVVQTGGTTGTITIAAGAEVTNTALQDGGKGAYSDNTARCDLPARAFIGGGPTPLTAGGTYSAAGGAPWTLESYTMTYCTNGASIDKATDDYKINGPKYATETVAIGQSMNGVWRDGAVPPELPGDLNGDGKVDVTDLNLLLANYQGTGLGDIDGNDKVDVTDLNLLLANYQKTLGDQ